MFLRHLATEGQCRPGLEHALLSPANWSQQSLPRGLSSEQVQQVLKACPTTPTGVRDRAILLLLIRLGLRAGDVAGLHSSDLCFDTATIRVSGKGRREVRLPLPQDVGDALLDYLRVRPCVQSERVFVSVMAPFNTVPIGRRCQPRCADCVEARRRRAAELRSPPLSSHGCVPDGAPGRRSREHRRGPPPSVDRDDGHLCQGRSAPPRAGRSTVAGGGAMLTSAVNAYLARRRAVGFQLRDTESILRNYASFAAHKGDVYVRTRTVLEWIRVRSSSPLTNCVRLRDGRSLCSLSACGRRAP